MLRNMLQQEKRSLSMKESTGHIMSKNPIFSLTWIHQSVINTTQLLNSHWDLGSTRPECSRFKVRIWHVPAYVVPHITYASCMCHICEPRMSNHTHQPVHLLNNTSYFGFSSSSIDTWHVSAYVVPHITYAPHMCHICALQMSNRKHEFVHFFK